MKGTVAACFALCLVSGIVAYNDYDLKCSSREHLTGFVRAVNNNKREISHRCSKFNPQLNSEPTCTLGNAMQCNGQEEGCTDPDAWIGGLQVFDSGSGKAELYRPYCCRSDQVSIQSDKCRSVQLSQGNGRQIRYFMPGNRLLHRVTCQYVTDGSGLKDMSISSLECSYAVDKKRTG